MKKYDPFIGSAPDGFSRRHLIKLSCGHEIRSALSRPRPNAKFPCNAGMGCGYNLPWVSLRDGDFYQENKDA